MIAGALPDAAASPERAPRLDQLFAAAAERDPQAWAIADPPQRDGLTAGQRRCLRYANADAVVSAIARRLTQLGLPEGSVVAVQMPNGVEGVLLLLGVLRAGMVAALVPLLWRQLEMSTALARVGARVLITTAKVGAVSYGEIATQVAAENFAIRFVCGFGEHLPDGVIAFNDVFDVAAAAPSRPAQPAAAAQQIAVITFEVSAEGIIPVARSHAELLAAGGAVARELKAAPGAAILGGFGIASLAGLASVLIPWLLRGGHLLLHHGFCPEAWARQAAEARLIVLSGPMIRPLWEAGLLEESRGRSEIVGVWRAPERLATSAAVCSAGSVVDVGALGEFGVVARRRDAGALTPLALKPAGGPQCVLEGTRTLSGTLALRGACVPQRPFPPDGSPLDLLALKFDEDGFVDTGYPCRSDPTTQTLILSGPPAGIVSVGGYRFSLREVQEMLERIAQDASVAALPDPLTGHRLAGVAATSAEIHQALAAAGVNPLLAAAFGKPDGSSSGDSG